MVLRISRLWFSRSLSAICIFSFFMTFISGSGYSTLLREQTHGEGHGHDDRAATRSQ